MADDRGHRLAMTRHGQRMSQIDLARKVGITQKHLSQIETGASPFLSLSSGTLMRLAKALHVTTDFLLGMDEDDAATDEDATAPRNETVCSVVLPYTISPVCQIGWESPMIENTTVVVREPYQPRL